MEQLKLAKVVKTPCAYTEVSPHRSLKAVQLVSAIQSEQSSGLSQ